MCLDVLHDCGLTWIKLHSRNELQTRSVYGLLQVQQVSWVTQVRPVWLVLPDLSAWVGFLCLKWCLAMHECWPQTYTLYILDTVPPIHVLSNHVATDKLTTANGGTFTQFSQPDSVANHVKACRSLIERSVTWLATEFGWARSKRSAICIINVCGGFTIFRQCCPCDVGGTL